MSKQLPIPERNHVVIERVTPEVCGGRHAIKRVVGDDVPVEADIYTHGHDALRARVRYRAAGEAEWRESEMAEVGNDRWRGSFMVERNARYFYTVVAWRDPYLSWVDVVRKKHEAKVDWSVDLLVGAALVAAAAARAEGVDRERLLAIHEQLVGEQAVGSLGRARAALGEALGHARADAPAETIAAELERVAALLERAQQAGNDERPERPVDICLGAELRDLMTRYPDRDDSGTYGRVLEVFVDRVEAGYASWYEMWPRSQGTDPKRSATFDEMAERLPEIKRLGFHVVYLPPIHPIGVTNRKGPNNSLECPPGSPGCPYAIGNADGGHTAIEPGLGTIDDFDRFERAVREHGMEVALDLALQCSPDHPWVREHPEWFKARPDGSIQYAENPPKKYQDIYPLDFGTSDREGLYNACLEVVRFWVSHGVKTFRVDNPHTKPTQFWEWLIAEVQRTDPDVLFLSEAFTRPKVMRGLGQIGFSQSYTYFTWRNFKAELAEYFEELCTSDLADVMRGNLFTNTPDILPGILQNAPRSAFMMRATLAATLGSVWGMYNGFELCEGTPIPGKEEYLDSEKYDFKVWDWERPGNIKQYIGQLNRIREQQPALQRCSNLRFVESASESLLAYAKRDPDGSGFLLIIVNLDPHHAHEGDVEVPIDELDVALDETYQVHDLLSDERYLWRGASNYVRLDPAEGQVAHIFRVRRWSHTERGFDYFL